MAATETVITGADLRTAREQAAVDRAEIAAEMRVVKQRVANIEDAARVTPAAAARYRTALKQVLVARLEATIAATAAQLDPESLAALIGSPGDADQLDEAVREFAAAAAR